MNELVVFLGLWTSMGAAYEAPNACVPRCHQDANPHVAPLYGNWELGASWQVGSATVEIGGRHESLFLTTADGGRDQVFVRVKLWVWRP